MPSAGKNILGSERVRSEAAWTIAGDFDVCKVTLLSSVQVPIDVIFFVAGEYA
jgi:hypothetical protein